MKLNSVRQRGAQGSKGCLAIRRLLCVMRPLVNDIIEDFGGQQAGEITHHMAQGVVKARGIMFHPTVQLRDHLLAQAQAKERRIQR